LRSQYRSPQEFSLELLKESESTLNKIIDFTEDINPEPKNQNLLDIFEECMNEDLNTPKILGEIFKLINTSDTLDNQELLDLKSTIKYLFYVLGFDLAKKELTRKTDEEFEEFFKRNGKEFKNIEDSVNDFILERENLRNKKDYEAADKMRDEILEMGIILEDGVDGGWSWKSN